MRNSMLAMATAVLLVAATTASAHHAFAQEFDKDNPVTLNGTVTKVLWANPHVYTYLNVKDAKGKTANWKVEMGSPEELMKAGWTKTTLKAGEKVTLTGWRAKNGTNVANAEEMTLPDGAKLSTASSHDKINQGELARNKSKDQNAVGTSGKSTPAPKKY